MITSENARQAVAIIDSIVSSDTTKATFREFENAKRAFGILNGFIAQSEPKLEEPKVVEETPN